MCLAVAGRIEKKLDGGYATIDFGGIKKKVSIELIKDAKVGDYVMVHVGFAISKVDKEEADESLRLINEAFGDPRKV